MAPRVYLLLHGHQTGLVLEGAGLQLLLKVLGLQLKLLVEVADLHAEVRLKLAARKALQRELAGCLLGLFYAFRQLVLQALHEFFVAGYFRSELIVNLLCLACSFLYRMVPILIIPHFPLQMLILVCKQLKSFLKLHRKCPNIQQLTRLNGYRRPSRRPQQQLQQYLQLSNANLHRNGSLVFRNLLILCFF